MTDRAAWIDQNRLYLKTLFRWTGCLFDALLADADRAAADLARDESVAAARVAVERYSADAGEPAFVTLCRVLGLSQPERDILALCLAVELDARQSRACSRLQGLPGEASMTFGLASALLEDMSFDVMLPTSALRDWQLVTMTRQPSEPLLEVALALDERVMAFVNGSNVLDRRVNEIVRPAQPLISALPRSQAAIVDELLSVVRTSYAENASAVVQLVSRNPVNSASVARAVADAAGLDLYRVDAAAIPAAGRGSSEFVRLWEREQRLVPLALYIQNDADAVDAFSIRHLVGRCSGVFFVGTVDGSAEEIAADCTVDVGNPTPAEQRDLWCRELGDAGGPLADRIAEQFSLDAGTIQRVARSGTAASGSTDRIWQACRRTSRRGLDALAERIAPRAAWDDLVLPPDSKTLLRQLVEQVRSRHTVYEQWGFRQKLSRGLGVSALFSGESGTGKTMAAEVIAAELSLDLYRIDLSAVVSKYIGETAKNLRRIFAAAEACGAILFFDEADALFGKRSEVKDSHDRYANTDIAFLLQRMEAYEGLAILATNVRRALDHAFTRRLRIIVNFERPSRAAREAIWARVFPERLPLAADFDPAYLAGLQLTGGSIQGIAMQASFMAASAGARLDMTTILEAARREFEKLQLPVKDAMFRWQPPEAQEAATT